MVASSCHNIGRCTPNSNRMPKLMWHPAGMVQGIMSHALPVVVPISSDSQTAGDQNALLDAGIATSLKCISFKHSEEPASI